MHAHINAVVVGIKRNKLSFEHVTCTFSFFYGYIVHIIKNLGYGNKIHDVGVF